MNKIQFLIKQGWIVDEIRYDLWQKWYYVHAIHESQDCDSANGASDIGLSDAIEQMYNQAISLTPKWYLEQLKSRL